MVADYNGHRTDLPSLRQRFQLSLKGAPLTRLIGIATTLGFQTRAIADTHFLVRRAQSRAPRTWTPTTSVCDALTSEIGRG